MRSSPFQTYCNMQSPISLYPLLSCPVPPKSREPKNIAKKIVRYASQVKKYIQNQQTPYLCLSNSVLSNALKTNNIMTEMSIAQLEKNSEIITAIQLVHSKKDVLLTCNLKQAQPYISRTLCNFMLLPLCHICYGSLCTNSSL